MSDFELVTHGDGVSVVDILDIVIQELARDQGVPRAEAAELLARWIVAKYEDTTT